jgi:hypothetical protein
MFDVHLRMVCVVCLAAAVFDCCTGLRDIGSRSNSISILLTRCGPDLQRNNITNSSSLCMCAGSMRDSNLLL